MGLEFFGIDFNDFPDIAGKYSGDLLVVGPGRCVWDDLEKFGYRNGNHDVMTLNDVGMHFPYPVTHWYSNDNKMLPKWFDARRPTYVREQGRTRPTKLHSCNPLPRGYTWPFPGHGSSGLGACYVGIALGYDRVILAGVPLDNSGHYFDPPWIQTRFLTESPDRYWENCREKVFDGKVSSLSGRSKELLGGPS